MPAKHTCDAEWRERFVTPFVDKWIVALFLYGFAESLGAERKVKNFTIDRNSGDVPISLLDNKSRDSYEL